MQIIVFDGNMVAKPEINYGKQDGKPWCRFTIANNEGFGDNRKVTFFNCTQFGKLAESTAKYTDKGSHVIVKGKIEQNNWTDKNGQKRSALQVIAGEVQFLDKKGEGSGQQDSGYQTYNDPWANNG